MMEILTDFDLMLDNSTMVIHRVKSVQAISVHLQ